MRGEEKGKRRERDGEIGKMERERVGHVVMKGRKTE